MRALLYTFLFISAVAFGQDKLFLKDGTKKNCMVISIGTEFIFFKNSDTLNSIQKISKSKLILLEKFDGKIFIFSNEQDIKDTSGSVNKKFYRNTIGLQSLNIFLGRITGTYEYLNKKGSIGFVVPVSLTFDPIGVIYNLKVDSTRKPVKHTNGFNLITGADVNFYLGKGDYEGFFIGPRVRYGTDMFFANIEAYTIQTQFGWRLSDPEDRLCQHISIGFGFVRILSSPAGNRINSKQSYGWLSFNYRIGISW